MKLRTEIRKQNWWVIIQCNVCVINWIICFAYKYVINLLELARELVFTYDWTEDDIHCDYWGSLKWQAPAKAMWRMYATAWSSNHRQRVKCCSECAPTGDNKWRWLRLDFATGGVACGHACKGICCGTIDASNKIQSHQPKCRQTNPIERVRSLERRESFQEILSTSSRDTRRKPTERRRKFGWKELLW